MQAAAIETDRGVTISCDLGLADVCRPSRLPTSDGILPGAVDPEPGVSEDDDGAVSEVSESLPGAVGLPFEECFAALSADFTGASPCGDAAGSYAAVSTSTRNVSVWDGPDTTAVDRRVTTAVSWSPAPPGPSTTAASSSTIASTPAAPTSMGANPWLQPWPSAIALAY